MNDLCMFSVLSQEGYLTTMQKAKEMKLNLMYVVVINHPIFSDTHGARRFRA